MNWHMHLPLSIIVVILASSRITSTKGLVRNSVFPSTINYNPCNPSPCGPNTRCEIAPRGVAVAQCRCMEGYVPVGHTINGCKPQCIRDHECPYDHRCQANKCVKVCQAGACGINAECEARNNRAICKCPPGYQGQAQFRCTKIPTTFEPDQRTTTETPNPCQPNPCGLNADCRVRNIDNRAVCSCPIGYQGDPLHNCIRGECIEATDCPGHLTCQRLQCIDPCNIPNICGRNAECKCINHHPICSCGSNMVGDPFEECRRIDPKELCSSSPCGRNTNCKVRRENNNAYRAVCTCIDNYIGDPLTSCHPECVSHSECPSHMACSNGRCVNPCVDACGEGAICDVVQGRAKCSCPQHYIGNPRTRCYPECTEHNQCGSYQACYQFQCVDPCKDACGTGAECKVENHTPICSCPKGYTGHPFESCEPFSPRDLCSPNPCGHGAVCTPGSDRAGNDRPICTCPPGFFGNALVSCQQGECQQNNDCNNNQACFGYACKDPCFYDNGRSVCGFNAECNVRNHQPVCSCPRGYEGNPLQACSRKFTTVSGCTRCRLIDHQLLINPKISTADVAH